MGNPGVFGLASLGFALTVLGFQFVAPHEGTGGATTYAVLVAAVTFYISHQTLTESFATAEPEPAPDPVATSGLAATDLA